MPLTFALLTAQVESDIIIQCMGEVGQADYRLQLGHLSAYLVLQQP